MFRGSALALPSAQESPSFQYRSATGAAEPLEEELGRLRQPLLWGVVGEPEQASLCFSNLKPQPLTLFEKYFVFFSNVRCKSRTKQPCR